MAGLFWEVAIKGFILLLSLLPLQPAQVWETIKPSLAPNSEGLDPAPVSSSSRPWERKERSIHINYSQIRSVSTC